MGEDFLWPLEELRLFFIKVTVRGVERAVNYRLLTNIFKIVFFLLLYIKAIKFHEALAWLLLKKVIDFDILHFIFFCVKVMFSENKIFVCFCNKTGVFGLTETLLFDFLKTTQVIFLDRLLFFLC
jgi:hypothetical protein